MHYQWVSRAPSRESNSDIGKSQIDKRKRVTSTVLGKRKRELDIEAENSWTLSLWDWGEASDEQISIYRRVRLFLTDSKESARSRIHGNAFENRRLSLLPHDKCGRGDWVNFKTVNPIAKATNSIYYVEFTVLLKFNQSFTRLFEGVALGLTNDPLQLNNILGLFSSDIESIPVSTAGQSIKINGRSENILGCWFDVSNNRVFFTLDGMVPK
jgi:hypothetical protein